MTTPMATPELSVVVPVHNEGLTIASTLTTWLDALTTLGIDAEVIVVDDGSTDATPHLLDEAAAGDARLRVVHQRQGGHGRAVLAGYRAARGAWVFQFDGDDEIGAPAFAAVWSRRHEAPLVLGVRDGHQRAPVRRRLTRASARLLSAMAGCDIADPNVPFRLIARPTLEHALARMPEDVFAPNVALTLLTAMSGARIAAVPVVERPRVAARRGLGGWRLYRGVARALRETASIALRERRQRRR